MIHVNRAARSLLLRCISPFVLVLAATGVRVLLDPVLADRAPLSTFYAAVAIAAWYGGFWPAIVTLLLGAIAADYFFMSPQHMFEVVNPQDRVSLWLYLTVGMIIAGFTQSLRGAHRRAEQRSTELAEVQQQLRDRIERLADVEQRVRAVVDHVVDGIITISEQCVVESFNPAAERIFGYKAEEVIGRNVNMLMPEPYHSQHDSYVANYRYTGQAKIIGIGREVMGRRKDGSVFPMDLAVSEFHLGSRRMFAGIVRDLGERKRAAQVFKFLADASTSLAALVDYESTLNKVARLAVPFFADWCTVDILESDGTLHRVGIAHIDPGMVLRATDVDRRSPPDMAAEHGPGRVVRSGMSELISEIQDEMLCQFTADEGQLEFLRSLGLKSVMSVPLEIRGKVLGVITFVAAESGHCYGPDDLAIAEDLAHRAAVALENARLYAEVKEGDRRKDEFLAMLAHELRNPLAPIRSGLDLLDMEGVDPETAAWARDMMKQQVQHMVRLVDDLLDVSRIMRGKVQLRREPVQLAEIIGRSVQTARPLIDAQGHQIILSVPHTPIWIEADPVRIAQVVANLLNNAAKYNDKPGHIWLTAERADTQAILRVRDDGIGIEKDLLPRVFDLFTQADRSIARSQGGLGIGLTLVRSLVERHGGTIEARSEGPGKGSEFIVRLPLLSRVPGSERRPGRHGEPRAEVETPHHRVLVVDDNVDAARTLSEIATLWHHDVHVAHNGVEALEAAKTYHPDVVLLDIGLPGMSGYQVAQELRRQPEFAQTMLIAITGYGQEEDRRRSREAGFNHHLVKPVTPDALYELLSVPANAG